MGEIEARDRQPISTAPKGRPILVWDKPANTWRAVTWMTSLEEGDGAWIYARKLAIHEPHIGEAMAFSVSDPQFWCEQPPAVRDDDADA